MSDTVLDLPPNVTPEMLRPAFWLERAPKPDAPLLASAERDAFNARAYTALNIPPVLDLPDRLPAREVRQALDQYQPPASTHYGPTGEPLPPAYFEALRLAASPNLPDPVEVQFGLIVRRAAVRSFPTAEIVTSKPFQFAFDRLQETTVDLGWPVATVATSCDGAWYFCLTPLYWGWIAADRIAFGTRAQMAAYVNAGPFVVATASRGRIALTTGGSAAAQMGTRLPLVQTTDDAYRVTVPRRLDSGMLELVEGVIAREMGEFVPGYLPCTLRTVFTQAFRLLGEPYALGGSRVGQFGRDCSRFIRDVYATTGVYLPRNSYQQSDVGRCQAVFKDDMPPEARKAALVEQVSPGAILAMPGHVMLYLGHVNGEPYVIHDTSSGPYAHVIVSDLSLRASAPRGPLLQRLGRAVAVG
ncbi:MAG: hypothetical protein GXY36_03830 [Chloroflexi bacterium]|nr:hypothetical protein [Chloroflexota bacterium]